MDVPPNVSDGWKKSMLQWKYEMDGCCSKEDAVEQKL
jgi:hypothetical protein